MFHPEEPRDTRGRWISLGRGDLERLMHAAVEPRARDIAAVNGHDEGKAQQIQAHLRRQALAKLPAAPTYHVRIADFAGGGGQRIDVQAAGARSYRQIKIPNRKRLGNMEQIDRVHDLPAPNAIDKPEVHGEVSGTGTIAKRIEEAAPFPEPPGPGYDRERAARRAEHQRGVLKAAHAVAGEKRKGVAVPKTALPEKQARQMEAAAAAKRVGKVAGDKAAALIREKGGAEAARKVAKGVVKKALNEEFGTPEGMGDKEKALTREPLSNVKWFQGAYGGINKGKGSATVGGSKVFIKLDSGAYAGQLRDGVPRKRPDGPPERGSAIVGNIMGVNGGIDGRMPIVVLRDNIEGQGPGMLKEYVNGTPAGGGPSTGYKREHLWMALDLAIGNLDRHGGNHIQSNDGRDYFPMDHGLAFPDDGSHGGLNRGISRVYGQLLNPEERAALQKLVDNEESLTKQLRGSKLSNSQVASMWGRVKGALANNRYPHNEREAAQWGKPGRVEADPKTENELNPAGFGRAGRADFRRRLPHGRGDPEQLRQYRDEAARQHQAALDAGDDYAARRWDKLLEQVDAKLASLAAAGASMHPSDIGINDKDMRNLSMDIHARGREEIRRQAVAAAALHNLRGLRQLAAHARAQEIRARAGAVPHQNRANAVRKREWHKVYQNVQALIAKEQDLRARRAA